MKFPGSALALLALVNAVTGQVAPSYVGTDDDGNLLVNSSEWRGGPHVHGTPARTHLPASRKYSNGSAVCPTMPGVWPRRLPRVHAGHRGLEDYATLPPETPSAPTAMYVLAIGYRL